MYCLSKGPQQAEELDRGFSWSSVRVKAVSLHWEVTEEQTVNKLTVSWQCSLVATEAKAFLAGEGRWSFLITLGTDKNPSGVLDSLVLKGYKLSGAARAQDCVWEAERAGTCWHEEEKMGEILASGRREWRWRSQALLSSFQWWD